MKYFLTSSIQLIMYVAPIHNKVSMDFTVYVRYTELYQLEQH